MERFLIALNIVLGFLASLVTASPERRVANSHSKEAQDPSALWTTTGINENAPYTADSYFAVFQNLVYSEVDPPMSSLGSLEFPGNSSAFLHIPNANGDLDGTEAFTWMFYIFPHSDAESVILNYKGTTGSPGIQFLYRSEKIIVRTFSATSVPTDVVSDKVKAPLNQWSLVGITYNRLWETAANLDIIDSANTETFSVPSNVVTTGDIRMGVSWDGLLPFSGKMSCFQFYRVSLLGKALSPVEDACDIGLWETAEYVEPTMDITYYINITATATTPGPETFTTTLDATTSGPFTSPETFTTALNNVAASGQFSIARPVNETCMKFTEIGTEVGLVNTFLSFVTSAMSECVKLCSIHLQCMAFSVSSAGTECELGSTSDTVPKINSRVYSLHEG